MGSITLGPFTEADGEVRIDLGFEVNYEWHEITVSVFDDSGEPATTGVTGTLSAKVLKLGADREEDFTESLNLSANDRSWDPELSMAEAFFTTVTGLNTDYSYRITVNSWGIA